MSRRDPRIFLHDMLDYSREALALAHGRTRADLDGDRVLSLALTRLIEIIGEAASRIPADVRSQFPAIPWPQITGMRNRLIHAYQAVDHDVVWDTLIDSLPSLIAELEHALPPEDKPSEHQSRQ